MAPASRTIKEPEMEEASRFPLGPRGFKIEEGTMTAYFPLGRKSEVWLEGIGKILQKTLRSAYDYDETYINKSRKLDNDLEDSLNELLSFLIQHEYLSVYSTSKFIHRISPYFAEVPLTLGIHVATDIKHICLINKRMSINNSVATIVPDIQYAFKRVFEIEDFQTFLLMVKLIGQGAISDMLSFVSDIVNDEPTSQLLRKISQEEGIQSEFAILKIRYSLLRNEQLIDKIVKEISDKSIYVYVVSGVEEKIIKSLASIAGGGSDEESIERGMVKLKEMYRKIEEGRIGRLKKAGIEEPTVKKIVESYGLAKSGLC